MSDLPLYQRAGAELRHNPPQWSAYESRSHCVVLAGPGSGKTKTLTAKMARLLAEDVNAPRGVACITYNNECARELEDRLAALGVEPNKRVFIGTVHSFSLTQIILPYAKSAGLGLPDRFSVATKEERLDALAEAIQQIFGKPANPQDFDFQLGNYRRSILKRDSAEWRETDPKMARLAEAFEEELRRRGLIDFDDMPLLALNALRNNVWLRRALLAKYPVLVVDEYQDLGVALHRMVMGLCFSTGIRLFAVGDVDQSIYGFIGARPNLLRRLSERDDVETVKLQLNYRSGNRIVAASGVALGEERSYKAADEAAKGMVYTHSMQGSYEQQAKRLISELIPQALECNPELDYRDIAVLYPAAWIGNAIAGQARGAGLPIVRTDSNSLYPRSSRLMQWVELCGRWCCGGWQAGQPMFKRLVNHGLRLFAESINSDQEILEFHRKLIRILWRNRDPDKLLHCWLKDLHESLIGPLTIESVTLRDELQSLSTFESLVAPTGEYKEMVLGEFAGEGEYLNRLTLSTLHSAKGREFEMVIMFGMDKGRLPRNGLSQNQMTEARRLFYVGFTRARTEVHLVHTANRASPFVDEIDEYLAAEV